VKTSAGEADVSMLNMNYSNVDVVYSLVFENGFVVKDLQK
jgi:hypothetical protein